MRDDTRIAARPGPYGRIPTAAIQIEARLPALQEFWRDCLEGLPAVTPLPLARTKPEPACRDGALVRHEVNPELASRCRDAALTAGVSPFQWFLAAWVVLLARYYNRDDIHLGTLLSMRDSTQENALAHFQNVLLFRTSARESGDVFDGAGGKCVPR